MTVANVASTVAGFGLVILEGFAQVPFLPYHIMGGTIADLVALALFVPLFFLSVAIELPVLRLLRKGVDTASLKRAIILANIGSYLMMSTFLVGRMIKSANVHGTLIV